MRLDYTCELGLVSGLIRTISVNPTALEYFVKVARAGSISRTAIELGIEQSTLTRHIAKLEADLGVRLFHRSGRGVVLTDAGSLLLSRAQVAVDALEATRKLAVSLADEGPSQLVIAAQPTIAHCSFAAISQAMRQRFPSTRLLLVESLGHQLIHHLVEGKIDVALLYVPNQASLVDFDVLLHEPLYFVAPAGLADVDDTISVRAMLEHPLILPSTPHGVHELVESLAASAGVPMKTPLACDGSNSLTRQLVHAGLGCAIMPLATVADEVQRGRLQAARLVEPDVTRDIALATARNRPPVIGQWDILQLIRSVINGLLAQGAWPGAKAVAGPGVINSV